MEEPAKEVCSVSEDPPSMLELVKKMRTSGLVKSRSWRFRSYQNVIVGNEMVDWMVNQGVAKDRHEAVTLGRNFVGKKFLRHVHSEHDFKDENLFYRFQEDETEPVGPPAEEAISCSPRHGLLTVKGLIKWNERYLVLDEKAKKIYYYITPKDKSPKRVIDISSGVNLTECSENCKTGSYCFNLTDTKGNTMLICAKHSKDQEGWIDDISRLGANFIEEKFTDIKETSIFDFTVTDIFHQQVPLSKYRNNVCLVVNVASQ